MVKYCINLDWFEAIIEGKLVEYDSPMDYYDYDQGRIRMVQLDSGTKLFKYRYEIMIDGKPFAKLNCEPRNTAILQPQWMQFQVYNNVLYEVGFIARIEQLFTATGWNLRNLTRVDIALDGHGLIQPLKDVMAGEVEPVGRATITTYMTGKRQNNKYEKEITGFNVGMLASDKSITGYWKEKELEKSNKQYIRDYWEKTGINIDGNVERLELRLKNKEIKRLFGVSEDGEAIQFRWQDLDNFEVLAGIFQCCCEKFFEFVRPGYSNITRAERVEYIDWDSLGAVMIEKDATRQSNEVYRYKLTAKSLYWLYLKTGKEYFYGLAVEIADNMNSILWMAERLEKWKHEFENRRFDYLHQFREYQHLEQLIIHFDGEKM